MSDSTILAAYLRSIDNRLQRLERQDKSSGGGGEVPGLADLLAVDGAGSGLDADLLDGNHASAFATSAHTHTAESAAAILTKLLTVDGTTSGLDADLLDGHHSSNFSSAFHTHSDVSAVKKWHQVETWAAGGPFTSRIVGIEGITPRVVVPLVDVAEENHYFYKVTATVAWYGAGYYQAKAKDALVFYVRGNATATEYEQELISDGGTVLHIELGTNVPLYPSIKPTTAWNATTYGQDYSMTVDMLIEQYALPYDGVYNLRNYLANPLPLPNFTDIGGVPMYAGNEIAVLPLTGGDAATLGGYAEDEFTSRRDADEVTYSMAGTGWKRIARFGGGTNGRGEITLLVSVKGNSSSTAMRIHAAHGSAFGVSGITVDAPLCGSGITKARVVNDSPYAFLELYFTATGVPFTFRILRDDAWSGAGIALMTGEANGSGTLESTAYIQTTGISTSGTIQALGDITAIDGNLIAGGSATVETTVTAAGIAGKAVTLADNATSVDFPGIGAGAAIMIIRLGTDGDVALVTARGATTMAVTIIAAVRAGNFSATKDTAGKLNLYYDDATSFTIQNKRGGSRVITVLRLGT